MFRLINVWNIFSFSKIEVYTNEIVTYFFDVAIFSANMSSVLLYDEYYTYVYWNVSTVLLCVVPLLLHT